MIAKTVAVLTISDKGFKGERIDTSGPALCKMLEEDGWKIEYTSIVPDEKSMIEDEMLKCTDQIQVALLLTTGGTGFSPRDITPEATKAVIERETPGIPEVMRAESMKITPHGCLSRGVSGIRKNTLIVNLPGSEKAAKENLQAVLPSIEHGVKMIRSKGSADCAEQGVPEIKKISPSMDEWIKEAKKEKDAGKCGMYLFHNGVVRETSKAQARFGVKEDLVKGMYFSYDKDNVEQALCRARKMPGIYYVKVWLNEGNLNVGDDIMYVLVGGDIRPNVIDALQSLVEELKTKCVVEKEI